MPDGLFPISIVFTTVLVPGSIRDTVPSAAFATQTEPAPTATATGSSPTEICPMAEYVLWSILVTLPSPLLVTQAAPKPYAMPVDRRPTSGAAERADPELSAD